MRVLLRRVCLSVGLLAAGAAAGAPATLYAHDLPTALPWREVWSGAEASRFSWSVFAGQTWSLTEHVRFRAVAGTGAFRTQPSAGAPPSRGTVSFADILLGYQLQSGALTIKVFAGATIDALQLPTQMDEAVATGARLVLEGWLNLNDKNFAALDLSWGSAHDLTTSRLRLGHRLYPWLAVGVEGGHVGNPGISALKGGLFLRGEWSRGEASLSFGASDDDQHAPSVYGTVNVLIRY